MKKFLLLISIFISLVVTHADAQIWYSAGPASGPIWCATSWNDDLLVGTNAGVYVSQDGGISYSTLSVGMPSGRVISLIEDDGILLASIENRGIYRSADGGVTWSLSRAGNYLRNSVIGNNEFRKIGDYVFANNYPADDSLFFSNDQGLSWIAIDAPPYSSSEYFSAGSYIYWYNFGIVSPVNGWYRSSDFGVTWTIVSDLPDTGGGEILEALGAIYYLSQHVYRSEDDGNSWTQLTTSTFTPVGSSYPFSPTYLTFDGQKFIGHRGGNASLSAASWQPGDQSWIEIMNGLPANGSVASLFSFQGNTYLSRRESQYVFSGAQWENYQFAGVNADKMMHISANGSTAYMVTETQMGMMGDDTWTWQKSIIPGTAEFQGASSIVEKDGKIFVSAGDAFSGLDVLVSEDEGESWNNSPAYFGSNVGEFVVVNDTLHYLTTGGDIPLAAAFDENGEYLDAYNATSQGFSSGATCYDMVYHNGVYYKLSGRTYDNGTNVSYRNPGEYNWINLLNVPDLGDYRTEAMASFDGRLFMGMWANGEVVASSDDGQTWLAVTEGITGKVVYDFEQAAGKLYAATDEGVFVLGPNDVWENISYNLPVAEVTHLAATPMFLLAHLQGGGAWRMAISDEAAIHDSETQTIRIYPNPAKDIMNLDTETPCFSFRIYNNMGGLVKEQFVNSPIRTIDIQDLDHGLYFILLDSGAKLPFVVAGVK